MYGSNGFDKRRYTGMYYSLANQNEIAEKEYLRYIL